MGFSLLDRRGWGIVKPPATNIPVLDFAHPLTRSLVACWLFNDGGLTCRDIVSGKYNGTMASANVTRGMGRTGLGVSGDSTANTNAITIASLTTGTVFSIEAWVRQEATLSANYGVLLEDGGFNSGLFLHKNGSNTEVQLLSGASLNSATFLTLNTWYHVVATCTLNTQKIYLNGKLDASGAGTTSSHGWVTMFSGSGSPKLQGTMDLMRFWSRDLTQAEVTWLYNEPFAMLKVPVMSFRKAAAVAGGIPNKSFQLNQAVQRSVVW